MLVQGAQRHEGGTLKAITITRIHADYKTESESFDSPEDIFERLLQAQAKIVFDMGRASVTCEDRSLGGFRWVVDVDGEEVCKYEISEAGKITVHCRGESWPLTTVWW